MVYFLPFSQTQVRGHSYVYLAFDSSSVFSFLPFLLQPQAVVLVAALVIAPSFVAFLAIELIVQVYTWWHFC